jgi:DNA-directed RNA polymerase subunit K/omega
MSKSKPSDDTENENENEKSEYASASDSDNNDEEEEEDDEENEEEDEENEDDDQIEDKNHDADEPILTETGEQCMYNYVDDLSDEDDNILLDNLDESKIVNELFMEGDDRITSNMMTKYEYVQIMGVRTKQLDMGAKKFIKNEGNLSNKEIALLELQHKVIPMKIKRPLPNGRYEIWKVSELSQDAISY